MTSSQDALITVVIPLFNGVQHIAETVRSVLLQTHERIEVIVIDDGSTDNGADLVNAVFSDDRLRLTRNSNQGIARTRNAGIRLASPKTAFFVFMDHDDVIDPSLFTRLVDVLDTRPDAVAAYAIADYIDTHGAPLHSGAFAAFMRNRSKVTNGRVTQIPPDADATFDELFLANHIYPPSGLLVRAHFLHRIGGFDESYRVADDWDALVRLSRIGPIAALDEVLVSYRRHATNASSNNSRNVRETRAVWARTYYSSDNTPAQQQILRNSWRGMQRHKFLEKSRAARIALKSTDLRRSLLTQADAVAHLLLPHPLRRWGR